MNGTVSNEWTGKDPCFAVNPRVSLPTSNVDIESRPSTRHLLRSARLYFVVYRKKNDGVGFRTGVLAERKQNIFSYPVVSFFLYK